MEKQTIKKQTPRCHGGGYAGSSYHPDAGETKGRSRNDQNLEDWRQGCGGWMRVSEVGVLAGWAGVPEGKTMRLVRQVLEKLHT